MLDFGPGFSELSPSEQSAVQLCVDEMAKEYPEAAGTVTVSKTAVGITVTIYAPGKYENIVSYMVEHITSIMLSTGVLLFLTQGRSAPANAAAIARRDEAASREAAEREAAREAAEKEAAAKDAAARDAAAREAAEKEAAAAARDAAAKEAAAKEAVAKEAAAKEAAAKEAAAKEAAAKEAAAKEAAAKEAAAKEAPAKEAATREAQPKSAPITGPVDIVCSCGNLVPAGEPYCNVCGNILEALTVPAQTPASAPATSWPVSIPTALKSYGGGPSTAVSGGPPATVPAPVAPASVDGHRQKAWTSNAVSLFQDGNHFNVQTSDDPASSIDLTRHLIIHGRSAMLLDPGGYKVFPRIMSELEHVLGRRVQLDHIVLSHEGPDVASGLNSWMMTTKATTWISRIWVRFVPHYGLDERYWSRLKPIPDEGLWVDLGGAPIAFVPAHYQHSPGNFHVWDPTSKILYTSDLGASLNRDRTEVDDFDAYAGRIFEFHQRHVGGLRALQPWARMVAKLDPEMIVPQHGQYFKGKAMVARFLEWCVSQKAGTDLLPDAFALPPQ